MRHPLPAPTAAIAGSRRIHAPVKRPPVPAELIGQRIYVIRGQKVTLDSDLAGLYQVETKALNRAVKRNPTRFPGDFMFQLAAKEDESLRCQIGTSNEGRGGRRNVPFAFTAHGVAMLSSVLNSERAVQMSILIVRAFVKLREVSASHRELARKMKRLEHSQKDHSAVLSIVVKDVQDLEEKMVKGFQKLRVPNRRKPRIGFIAER
jgi:phage regulator Rha-like protein